MSESPYLVFVSMKIKEAKTAVLFFCFLLPVVSWFVVNGVFKRLTLTFQLSRFYSSSS